MKKGYQVLLALTLSFIFLIIGTYIGRFTIKGKLSVEYSKLSLHNENETSDDTLSNGKVNINKAGVEELTLLPGIGETIAQRIITYREANGDFKTVEDLLNVEGIGEGRLSEIAKYITVSEE